MKPYVGDIGTQIVLDCGQDISSASARSIEARRPDGTTVSWPAVASGSNAISYTTDANSLNMPGIWLLQAKVTMGAGVWRGETAQLQVYAPFR
jgi:uncharacterized membrane protein